jgi:hypothetical protein
VVYKKAPAKTTAALSFARSRVKDFSGLGKDRFLSSGKLLGVIVDTHRAMHGGRKSREYGGGLRLPLPTTPRAVSGSMSIMVVRHAPDTIAKNQKIHRQPRL